MLDPFLGSGSVICSAYRKSMPSVGFELSEDYLVLTRERLEAVQGAPQFYPRLINDSGLNLMQYLAPGSVRLCVTSPPYWDILNQKRTADGRNIRNYGNDPDDLGNIERYTEFLDRLQAIFQQVYISLEARAYCVVVVMDIRKKSDFYSLHHGCYHEDAGDRLHPRRHHHLGQAPGVQQLAPPGVSIRFPDQ